MGGGLLQLVCRGQQDYYLCKNPDFSLFKYVYKKHTNFAMETVRLDFNNTPLFEPNVFNGEYKCKILRYGDLLKNLYFCCTLPDIYSSSTLAFKWVKNIGNILVKTAIVKVDGNTIDTLTSDWLNIWNELTMGCDDDNLGKLIGNVQELNNPIVINSRKVILSNNKFAYNYYPASSKNNSIPSIKSHKLVVPLPFWFTRNPSLALPLLRLQGNEITLTIRLENTERLYTVYSYDINENVSPLFYNELYSKDLSSGIKKRDAINIKTFTKSLNIDPYIEATYVFLDNVERNMIFKKTIINYLVEQLEITSQNSFNVNNLIGNINVNTNKPTKEIIWITRRNDYMNKFNSHQNFTASIRQNNNYPILNKASIIWDKTKIIVDDKNYIFYNKIQPYQCHSNVPNEGIYLYSFAINPEKNNPSGYYNAAIVETKLRLEFNKYNEFDENYNLNLALNRHNKFKDAGINASLDNYLVDVYSITYNIFEIIGRSVGMKFA